MKTAKEANEVTSWKVFATFSDWEEQVLLRRLFPKKVHGEPIDASSFSIHSALIDIVSPKAGQVRNKDDGP